MKYSLSQGFDIASPDLKHHPNGRDNEQRENAERGVCMMDRRELVLAMLACSDGMPYTPVQIQKTIFLACRNLPNIITQGEGFDFAPYDYGPFNADVYNEIGQLRNEGLAVIAPSSDRSWNTYSANDAGLVRGREILASLNPSVRTYFIEISKWVRSQSFSSLVKSIYNLYPEMRANSVFQG